MSELLRLENRRVRSGVLRRIGRDHIERVLDDLDAGLPHTLEPATDSGNRERI